MEHKRADHKFSKKREESGEDPDLGPHFNETYFEH